MRIWEESKRRVVIHDVKNGLLDKINNTDYVFLDDARYSQYLFFPMIYAKTKNIGLCVSTFFIRDDSIEPKMHHPNNDPYIEKIPDAYQYFMSLSEIKNLVSFGVNIFLHGHKHVRLKNLSTIDQIKLFVDDLRAGIDMMIKLDLHPSGYVYPYDHKPNYTSMYLPRYLPSVDPMTRIYIEDI